VIGGVSLVDIHGCTDNYALSPGSDSGNDYTTFSKNIDFDFDLGLFNGGGLLHAISTPDTGDSSIEDLEKACCGIPGDSNSGRKSPPYNSKKVIHQAENVVRTFPAVNKSSFFSSFDPNYTIENQQQASGSIHGKQTVNLGSLWTQKDLLSGNGPTENQAFVSHQTIPGTTTLHAEIEREIGAPCPSTTINTGNASETVDTSNSEVGGEVLYNHLPAIHSGDSPHTDTAQPEKDLLGFLDETNLENASPPSASQSVDEYLNSKDGNKRKCEEDLNAVQRFRKKEKNDKNYLYGNLKTIDEKILMREKKSIRLKGNIEGWNWSHADKISMELISEFVQPLNDIELALNKNIQEKEVTSTDKNKSPHYRRKRLIELDNEKLEAKETKLKLLTKENNMLEIIVNKIQSNSNP